LNLTRMFVSLVCRWISACRGWVDDFFLIVGVWFG
jgi:hypothetical protein